MAWYSALLKKEGSQPIEVSFHVHRRNGRERVSSQSKVVVTRTTEPTMGSHMTVGRLLIDGWQVVKSNMPRNRNKRT